VIFTEKPVAAQALIAGHRSSVLKRHIRFVTARFANLGDLDEIS